jgi:hypothetical protein
MSEILGKAISANNVYNGRATVPNDGTMSFTEHNVGNRVNVPATGAMAAIIETDDFVTKLDVDLDGGAI